jgi:hypothetical protein
MKVKSPKAVLMAESTKTDCAITLALKDIQGWELLAIKNALVTMRISAAVCVTTRGSILRKAIVTTPTFPPITMDVVITKTLI